MMPGTKHNLPIAMAEFNYFWDNMKDAEGEIYEYDE